MRLNSTGLGKTTLVVKIKSLTYEYVEGEGYVVKMNMESIAPVHWQMNARLQGPDLRDVVRAGLKLIANPVRLCRILVMLFRGQEGTVDKAAGQASLATNERR